MTLTATRRYPVWHTSRASSDVNAIIARVIIGIIHLLLPRHTYSAHHATRIVYAYVSQSRPRDPSASSLPLSLDNSEYMRNGDYPPTRFQAQAEAIQTVFTAKTDANPESAVGMMTMAGSSPSLLVTPTNDLGRLMHALSKVLVSNTAQLSTAISIAQLALKHRENKNQRQRIVLFVGSPLGESAESLVKLGKRLRKNNVFVDVVTFGDEGRDNDEKLRGLVEAAGEES